MPVDLVMETYLLSIYDDDLIRLLKFGIQKDFMLQL